MHEIIVAGQSWPVRLVRNHRARRLTLRFDGLKGEIRLSMPERANSTQALGWAATQHGWLQGQIGAMSQIIEVRDGTEIPYLGDKVRVIWQENAPRRVERDNGQLLIGGPREGVGRRTERWLRSEALALMTDETREYAVEAGVVASRVAIADPKSRWGSCSSDGTIRYNWRLIMAPDFVRRATVAHEVAHLVHMHHGPEFHALVDQIFEGNARKARRWLKSQGHVLHLYRFG